MDILLDSMGDNVGLIRLFIENFGNDLISKKEMIEGVNKALDELHEIQFKIGKKGEQK